MKINYLPFLLFVIALGPVQVPGLDAQFYISTNGSDTNLGTSPEHCFATLGAAQRAMRKSKVKITYIRAGICHLLPTSKGYGGFMYGLILNSFDSGETWSYYPPDGYNSAILDGGSSGPDSGLGGIVQISYAGVLWDGIQMQSFIWNAIFIYETQHTVITNCIIHDGTFNMDGDGKNIGCAGAIFALCSPTDR